MIITDVEEGGCRDFDGVGDDGFAAECDLRGGCRAFEESDVANAGTAGVCCEDFFVDGENRFLGEVSDH